MASYSTMLRCLTFPHNHRKGFQVVFSKKLLILLTLEIAMIPKLSETKSFKNSQYLSRRSNENSWYY